MQDRNKTKAQLLSELVNLRQRVARLQTLEATHERTEESLRLFKSAVQHARDAIVITSADLEHGPHIIFVNPAFTEITGYAAQEVIGQTPSLLQGPQTDQAVIATKLETLMQGRAFEGEAVNYRKDGAEFVMEARIAPIRNKRGQVTHFVSVQRDVTQHKQAEEEIKRLNQDLERRIVERTAQLEAANRQLESEIAERRQAEELVRIQRDLGAALSSTGDLMEALNLILDAALQIEGLDCGGVYLADPHTGELDLAIQRGLPAEFVECVSHYPADAPQIQLIKAGKPIYGRYSQLTPVTHPVRPGAGLRALGAIPVLHDGQLIALLNVASHVHDEVPANTRATIESMAAYIGGMLARVRAEATLRESLANLQTLFDTVDDFLFILDSEGRILQTNLAAQKRLGYPADELAGMNILYIHPPDQREPVAEIVAGMVAGQITSCHVPLMTKAGTLVPVETKVTRGRWGSQDALFGISRDLSDRQRTETALQESEMRYRTMFEASTDAIFLETLDGQVLDCNMAACRMFGYTKQQMLNLSVTDLVPGEVAATLPQVITQELTTGGMFIEAANKRKDGQVFSVEVRTQVARIGQELRVVAYVRDIAERKQAKEALEKSEAKYRSLIEGAGAGVATTDTEGKLTLVNQALCKMIGYSETELIGQPFASFIHPDDLARILGFFANAFQNPVSELNLEFQVIHRDGHIVHCYSNPTIFWHQGQIAGFNAIIQDITGRKQAEEALRENEERYRSFVQNFQGIAYRSRMDGTPFFFHGAVEEITGYTEAELVAGRPRWDQVIYPEDFKRIGSSADQVRLIPGHSAEREYRIVRKDGQIRWIHELIQNLCDDSREPRWVQGALYDVTERKQADEALRKSEALLHSIFRAAPTGIGLVSNRVLLAVNDRVCEMLGYSRQELLGKSARILYANDQDFESVGRTKYAEIRERGTGTVETRWQHKNGTMIEVLLSSTPLDPADLALGVTFTALDITERKRTERALRESNERFQVVLDSLGVGVYVADMASYEILFMNRYGRQARGDVIGQICWQALQAGQTGPCDFCTNARLLLPTGEPADPIEWEFQNTLNQRWYQCRDQAIRWTDGRIVRIEISTDITEHKQAEQELQAERDFAQQVMNAMGQGLTVADAEGRFEFVNPAYARMLGYARQELIGKQPGDSLPENDIHLARSRALQSEGKTTTYEMRLRRADEGSVPVLITETPRWRQGRVEGTIAVITDLTERKQAEEALRERQAKLDSILRAAPTGIGVVVNRMLTEVNDCICTMTGYSKQELVGQSVRILYSTQEDFESVGREKYQQIAERGSGTVETQFKRKDGSVLDVLLSSTPIVSGDIAAGITFTALDITERKQAEQEIRRLNAQLEQRVIERTAQLEAANKELEAFSYSVSHDLRAPLRGIDGFSRLLLQDYADSLDTQGRHYLERIRTATRQMSQLIDDLIKLSRVTRSEMHRKPVNLSALAQTIAAELQATQPDRHIEWVIASDLLVHADVALMRVVLVNLLGNACKFTAKHPAARIELGALDQAGQRVYFVRDDGAGFDMTYADKLFGAFQRLHSVDEFEGTGIGLATVKRIIRRHGGQVWAESAVEHGATIYFTLP